MKKRRHPDTLVESAIVIVVLVFIVFSLMQAIYLYTAQMITDYAAFNAVRSASVGFKDELVERAGQVAAIGASGEMIHGNGEFDPTSPVSLFGVELLLIPRMITGEFYWVHYRHTPKLSVDNSGAGLNMRKADVRFTGYPFEFPMWEAISGKPDIDIDAEAEMADHAGVFLEY